MKRVFPVILLILALAVAAGLAIDLRPAVAEAEADAVAPVEISSLSLVPPHSHLEIDYIDYVRLGGQTYCRVYEAVLNGPGRVGREIGRVKTTVSQLRVQLNRPERNGDAAYLPRGTALRAVKRFPASFLIAAADNRESGGYGVYVQSSYAHAWQYRFLPKGRVKRITIYSTDNDEYEVVKVIDDRLAIRAFIALLDSGSEGTDFLPDTEDGDPRRYNLVFDTGSPVAYRYNLFHAGTNYYWSPWDITVLPAGIGGYLCN